MESWSKPIALTSTSVVELPGNRTRRIETT